MKTKILTTAVLFAMLGFTASANAQIVLCQDDGEGMSAKLEFQPHSAGRFEALAMEYQERDVLKNPLSVFNHMGLILFTGENGIEFHTYENSDEFYVTVPAFFGGQPVVTARGKCRPKAD